MAKSGEKGWNGEIARYWACQFLSETDNDVARHQVRIRKALRKQPLTARALIHKVNAYRVGTEIHERALKGLLSIKDVKTRVTGRKDSAEYYLPKEAA